MHPDNKLKSKSHDKNHIPFTFSFHHIQLDAIVTYSLDATIDIDKSISCNINKYISYSNLLILQPMDLSMSMVASKEYVMAVSNWMR